MKLRTKLFYRVALATCTALLLATAVVGVSFANNKVADAASIVTFPSNAVESSSWSGYIAQNHVFNTVQAEITVPTVTCTTKNSNLLIWVGFDGFNEQKATTEQVGVGADCGAVGSKPNYYTWWEMYPTNNIQRISKSLVDIKPGDKIWATVSYNGSPAYNYTLRVRNTRTNQAKNYTEKCATNLACKRGSAEFIAERKFFSSTNTFAPLAKWSSDPNMFMYAKAAYGSSRTLKPLNTFAPTPIDMVAWNTTGHVLARVNDISSDGTTFTTTYKAAQ